MDRNTTTGFLLIGVVLVLYVFLSQPSEEEIEERKRQLETAENEKQELVQPETSTTSKSQDSPSEEGTLDTSTGSSKTAVQQTDSGLFAHATVGENKQISLENELIKVSFSHKGGRINGVEVNGYVTYDSLPLVLMNDPSNKFEFKFKAIDEWVSTDDYYFKANSGSQVVSGDEEKSISFRLHPGENKDKYIEQKYTLRGDSYMLDYDVRFVGFGDIIPINDNIIWLNWENKVHPMEKNVEMERQKSGIYYRSFIDGSTDDIGDRGSVSKEKLDGTIEWISSKQQFFNISLISKDKIFEEVQVEIIENEDDMDVVEEHYASIILPPFTQTEEVSYPMQFYLGPNHYQTLMSYDIGLQELIYLGWSILSLISKILIIPIFNFLEEYISSYGIIILVLTLIIKMLLSFFTYKSYVSMAKMRLLKPEIEVLKEKHKDPQKLNMETMKLYRTAGASPLGGCLPMLLQFPFLISMFYFFPSSIELRQEGFLWADDLSTYDSILDLGFEIPFYGDHVSLFTLLMTVSTIIYTRLNSQMTDATGQMAQMKWMQYLMPIMFLGIFNNFSSALTYYYFLANVISFGQQFFIKHFFVDEKKLHLEMQNKKMKPMKKSGFQKRLEGMAKEAEKRRKNR